MKKKSGKLSVSKATIANLGENEVRDINGGKQIGSIIIGGGESVQVCSVMHSCYKCVPGDFTDVAI
jgi:glutamine amidotransferase PdxT